MYSLIPGVTLSPGLDALKGGGIWLVTIWLLVRASIYVNAFSSILVALLGISRPLRVIVGDHPWSQDPSWPALRTFIWLNENVKPLVISAENAVRFADWLIRNPFAIASVTRCWPAASSRTRTISTRIFPDKFGEDFIGRWVRWPQ
jgi:hypothetical protein